MGGVMERLLVVVLCLGLVLSVKCVRTHERFSQTTYYANPNRVEPAEMLEENQFTGTVKEATTTIPGMESKEESRTDFTPTEVTQSGEISPEHKGTYTSGDFTADAKPWWVNPEYQNYGHSPLGKPSVDRYPSTFDPRFSNNYQHSRTKFNQYVQDENQVQYNVPENTKTNNGHDAPYELSGAACPTEFWASNTNRWPGFFNTKSTLGDAFGTPAAQVYGKTTIMEALLDTHDDGYHSLARTGCTALLNSYTRQQYKFSHQEVMETFNAALTSNKVAARQAAAFDEANLSTMKEEYNSCF